ncbi:alpha/beta fold hydrolase [Actinokineospora enzanensis]|uniref:alpha/beta fold hydrolase n=1 Tax=Actinokineospora enzanensis TaxID=155975 RepID=UPI000378205B|nr:alpha/beta hydrolase [Actinokineospora enzanensis]
MTAHLNVVDAGSGPVTVVLVHGWTMDHTCWDPVVERLAGVRVLRFDLRGHGRSDPAPPGTASIAQVADDLADLITTRVPDGPIVLAGHSLGGMALMALAERHPDLITDRVTGVAFVATTSGGLSQLTLGLPRRIAKPVLYLEKLLNRRLGGSRRPSLLGRYSAWARPGVRWLVFGRKPLGAHITAAAAQVGRCNPANMVEFRDSLNEHERLEALTTYQGVQAIVLSGGRDRLCPTRDARTIANALPNSRLAIYPDAGHMLTYERAQEVATHLNRLVTGAPIQASSSK